MRATKDSGVDWLGEIPVGWDVKPLKRAFSRQRRELLPDLGIVTAFRDGEVTLRSNRRSDGFTEADDYSNYQRIEPNDLAIHSMDAFAGCIGVSDSTGMCSPVLSVCEPIGGNSPQYMAYLLRLMSNRGWIEALSRSIRERTSEFRWAEAGAQIVAVPPPHEQAKIVDFLDRETAKIDKLIAKQEILIAMLGERRQAVVGRAVTRGLSSSRKMKYSGFDWLGDIPADWVMKPFFALGDQVKKLNRAEEEKNLLSLSYGEIIRKDIDANSGLLPESFGTYQIVEDGDLVFRFTDLQNDQKSLRSALVREHGIITSAYLGFRPSRVNSRFLNHLMRAYDLQKVFYAMGSGLRQSLTFAEVRRLSVVCPPLAEQQAIADFLDRETAQISALIIKAKRTNLLLIERRQSLISTAVTGNIDLFKGV
jgi:type I restriction enzyme S subunit